MTVEAELLATSAAWDAALLTNVADAFAGYVTDDWVYVGPTGPVSKADIVGSIASGQLAHHTMAAVGPARVAIHGETATVTAHKLSSGTWEGEAYTADEWITDVYVRRDGRWLCALSQKCPVEP